MFDEQILLALAELIFFFEYERNTSVLKMITKRLLKAYNIYTVYTFNPPASNYSYYDEQLVQGDNIHVHITVTSMHSQDAASKQ